MFTEGWVDSSGFSEPIARELDALLGGPASELLIDESGSGTKRGASAGVEWQWICRQGKVDRWQVRALESLCGGATWPA